MITEVSFVRKKGSRSLRARFTAPTTVRVSFPYFVPLTVAKLWYEKEKSSLLSIQEKKRERDAELMGMHNLPLQLFEVHTKEEIAHYKKQAKELVLRLLLEVDAALPSDFIKITITNTKTRWGSCSSKKVISFHYKILFLPKDLRDYLIVHELCHLKYMNHGPHFWELVETFCPMYIEKKKVLTLITTF